MNSIVELPVTSRLVFLIAADLLLANHPRLERRRVLQQPRSVVLRVRPEDVHELLDSFRGELAPFRVGHLPPNLVRHASHEYTDDDSRIRHCEVSDLALRFRYVLDPLLLDLFLRLFDEGIDRQDGCTGSERAPKHLVDNFAHFIPVPG